MNMKRIRSIVVTVLSLALVLVATPLWAQSVITGRVISEDGRTLANANVYINELRISVGTNAEGRYNITVPNSRVGGPPITLGARRLGFVPGVRSVTLTGGTQTVDFT